MEAITAIVDVPEQQSSFGIKKVVDCKIVEGGQQMYKVEWEATWEPAESLISCQHLVDEFWSFVNIAKANEKVALEHRKRMKLQRSANNLGNIHQNFNMSTDNKAEVQRLIARANATSVGSPILRSPSSLLMTPPQLNQHNQQNNVIPAHKSLDFSSVTKQENLEDVGNGQQNFTFPGQKNKNNACKNKGNALTTPGKVETNNLTEHSDGVSTGMSNLKYLENFTNPYVKIILVCKICNKELSLKLARNWRPHYLTHTDKKPHKCPHCSKSFIRADHMRKHVQSKHGNATSTDNLIHMNMIEPKQEHIMTPDGKKEGYIF